MGYLTGGVKEPVEPTGDISLPYLNFRTFLGELNWSYIPLQSGSRSFGNMRVWAIPEVTNVSTRRSVNTLSFFRNYDTEEAHEIERYVLGRDLHVPRKSRAVQLHEVSEQQRLAIILSFIKAKLRRASVTTSCTRCSTLNTLLHCSKGHPVATRPA